MQQVRFCYPVRLLSSRGGTSLQRVLRVLQLHFYRMICSFNQPIMDSSRSQGGIQLLLAAEQEAQHIVNAARAAKITRLKQAKDEADKEIARYRAHVEAEFQRKIAESSGDSGANVKRLEQETESKIHNLKEEASRISHDVVHMLLRHVTSVKN